MNRFRTLISLTILSLFMASCNGKLTHPGEGFEDDDGDTTQTESDTLESEDDDTTKYDKDSLDKPDIDYGQKPDDDSGDGPYCGNGFVDPGEECDKENIPCAELDEQFIGGYARCLPDCSGWNLDRCQVEVDDSDKMQPDDVVRPDADTTTPDEDTTIPDEDTVVTPDEDIPPVDEDSVVTPDEDIPPVDEDSIVTPDEDIPPVDEDVATPDEDIVVCVNECAIENKAECNPEQIVTCIRGEDGCLHWELGDNCVETGRVCDYSITISEPDDNNVRNTLFKGTFIAVTSDRTLKSFDQYLDLATEEPLTFTVYESDTETGTYTKVGEKIVANPGSGEKFYNSGSLTDGDSQLLLHSGKYYLIGVAWEGDVTSYYKSGFFTPQVETTPFGQTFGGTAEDATWPPPATLSGGSPNMSAYYQRFYTEEDDTSATCECNNECTLHDTQCDGDFLQVCDENTYSCTYWTLQENCAVNFPVETCEEGPMGAECMEGFPPMTDTIGVMDSSYTSSEAYFKGNYFSVDTATTVTEFQFYLEGPYVGDVYFYIYESDSLTTGYNRIFIEGVSVSSSFGFYGPEDISVTLTAGKYYLFSVRLPDSGYSYYYTTNQYYPTTFGQSEGSENFSSPSVPGTTNSDIDGPSVSSYHMTITSE